MIQYGEQSVKKQLDGASYNGTIDIIHQKVHEGVFFYSKL